MSESPIAVAFCYRGFPTTEVAKTWNPWVVPLNSDLLLYEDEVGRRIAWPTPEISLLECQALQAKLDADWLEVVGDDQGSCLSYYFHEYMDLAATLAMMRWTIKRILDQYTPSVVLIPDSLRIAAHYRTGRRGVLEAALATILTEETASIGSVVPFTEATIGWPGDAIDSGDRGQRLTKVLSRTSRVLANGDVARRVLRRVASRVGSTPRVSAEHPTALIIGQPAKTWALRHDSYIRRRTKYWGYEDLEVRFGYIQEVEWMDALQEGDVDATSFVARFIRCCAAANRSAHDSVREFARDPRNILLVTDGHHHPLIRQMVAEWTEAGHPAALIPEGVIHPVAATWPLMKHLFITGTTAARFVLCEAERSFWASRGERSEQLVRAGYMGDTHAHSGLGELLVRGMVARARAPYRGSTRGTVFVSFDVFVDHGDLGVRTLGVPTAIVTDRAYGQLLDELVRSGWFVIAKGRDHQVDALMRQRFRGMPIMFTTDVPWQLLARASDAVVTLTSSIGREAVQLGCPVVVWSPFTMPTGLHRNLEDMPPGTVTIAASLSDAMAALTAAVEPARSDPRPFSQESEDLLFGSTEEGLQWVRTHLGGSSRRLHPRGAAANPRVSSG